MGSKGIPPGERCNWSVWMSSFPAFFFPSQWHKESPLMVQGYHNYCCFHSSIIQIQLQIKSTPCWLMLVKWRKHRRKERRPYETGTLAELATCHSDLQWGSSWIIFTLIMIYLCKTPQCLPVLLLHSTARISLEHSLNRQKIFLYI